MSTREARRLRERCALLERQLYYERSERRRVFRMLREGLESSKARYEEVKAAEGSAIGAAFGYGALLGTVEYIVAHCGDREPA